jgi:hypothetical protein
MPKRHRKAVREPVKEQVGRRMAELKGQSRSDLERDDLRGASSPLGRGSFSKRERERK